MDEDNNQDQTIQPSHSPQSFTSPDGQEMKTAKTPMDNLKGVFSKLKPPTQIEVASPKVPKFKLPQISSTLVKKVAIIGAIILVLLVVLFVVVRMIPRGSIGIIPTAIPSMTPTPLPTITEGRPSPYFNDQEISSIKEELGTLDSLLNQATFREDTLRVPQLDWNVSF